MAGGYSAPGVYKKEIDLSNILVSTGISNGGIVIRSQKGPIRRPVLVTNDKEFIETFGAPYYVSGSGVEADKKLVPEFGYGSYGALEFLKESNTLYVVRAYDQGVDKYAACKIKTTAQEDTTFYTSGVKPLDSTDLDVFDTKSYISTYNKYEEENPTNYALLVGFVGPGLDGNNYAVTVETLNPLSDWLYNYDNYPVDSSATYASTTAYNPNGTYVVTASDTALIDIAPVWTTQLVQGNYNTSGGPDEVYKHFPIASNVVKVKVYAKPDDKEWTNLYSNSADAVKGRIRTQPLEVFYGSMTPKLDNDGNELFIENRINGNSKFIYVQANQNFANGTAPTASWDFDEKKFKLPDFTDNAGYYVVNTTTGDSANRLARLGGGKMQKTTGITGDAEFWSYFQNREELPVSILINTSSDDTTKMTVAEVCSSRKDCMSTNPVGDVSDLDIQKIMNKERYGYPAASYVSLYAGYSKIYDKYNDKYVYLPNSIFAAAIFARVDNVSAPWFAPAGTARGTIAVLDQNKIFSTDQIGRMYDKNINAIKLVPGAGFTIWGQRTAQLKVSALRSINVRRNLIYIQVNIENALNQFIFENNTQQTRLRVFSIIDEFLNNIKAGDGLYSYEVVCDNTNNPSSVIDANQLNVDIYVQPTKAIEFIQFTTVITRTGVNFGDVKLKYA